LGLLSDLAEQPDVEEENALSFSVTKPIDLLNKKFSENWKIIHSDFI
jgi:hypothetical protein